MLQELTIALRTLIKRPGYALSVILTLTIGIGASTMMFSLLDAAMLRPLPFAQPERLVMLTGVFGPERIPRGGSFPEVGDWRTMNRTLLKQETHGVSSTFVTTSSCGGFASLGMGGYSGWQA